MNALSQEEVGAAFPHIPQNRLKITEVRRRIVDCTAADEPFGR